MLSHACSWCPYCIVFCFKYFTAKLMLVPVFQLCCAHNCHVDAHAKNIPALIINVLCPILCKHKLLTQQLTVKFLPHPQLGGTSGVSVCTLVLHVHWLCLYSCFIVSQRPDQCTQAAQYRRLPTNQGPAGGYSSDQSEAEKIRHPHRVTESGTNQRIIYRSNYPYYAIWTEKIPYKETK